MDLAWSPDALLQKLSKSGPSDAAPSSHRASTNRNRSSPTLAWPSAPECLAGSEWTTSASDRTPEDCEVSPVECEYLETLLEEPNFVSGVRSERPSQASQPIGDGADGDSVCQASRPIRWATLSMSTQADVSHVESAARRIRLSRKSTTKGNSPQPDATRIDITDETLRMRVVMAARVVVPLIVHSLRGQDISERDG
eukprot:CAMPEP_0117571196 /NCGR_PEP_ID=MMETSP0784-20121206/59613_1 /TAXON_ID=39447 /ORGANISM="" /LENGTH=196 /DNA_ID=CAMNT_0005369321 /DNA_START=240 /DNA_END=829 /DNA_ORIENTATION=-